MADEDVTFTIGGRTFPLLDVDDLELGEVEQIEDAFNLPAEEIDFRRYKALRYLIFFSARRQDPSVKFEDLGSIKLTDLFPEDEEKPEPKARPTKAKAKAKVE